MPLGCERAPAVTPAQPPVPAAPMAPTAPASPQGGQEASGGLEPAKNPELVVQSRQPLPARPLRVVSLAPNVTEIAFALGAGPRVVAVTRYCDYPAEVAHLGRVGGMLDPDVEALAAARPDLVVGVMGGADRRVVDWLDGAKIPYRFVRMDTLLQTWTGIALLAEALGAPEQGHALVRHTQQALAQSQARFAPALARHQAAHNRPPAVVMLYEHTPLVAAGAENFGHELMGLLGVKNAAAQPGATPYPMLDVEGLLALDPDHILDASIGKSAPQRAAFWQGLGGVRAVAAGRVAYLEDSALLRAGPRLPQALEAMGEAIFGAPTAKEKAP